MDDLNLTDSQESNFKFIALTKQGIELIQKLTTKSTTKTTSKTSKKKSELTSADINLLFYIINNLTYENTATIPPQKIISLDLNLSQKQISLSIKKLTNQEIITKLNIPRTYFINPKFFYLGTDKKNKIIKWKKAIKEKKK
ncbi:replication/maintenance protein RepL [Lactobacillus kefiranofaciens]|uniref:Replication/maintenance protein RepL n=1 Tax=Lactobacillus kefiranofaciens TaxID=267818 RepID=A0AAX3UDS2_9LACO|nr:replication/maintenance protein RepL [Lactobacillus kefiranofaciens]AEG41733.1 possible rolling circle replication protein [Lactobacillus kefiranofaciens subsp. kefiranofaciens]KRM20894.1 rolling circle replication protein [Lactobacillus kefiranofaciens subsp. kefiranofaciens DSM 5016 = JCM 6985]QFQ68362.1 rolling circle replication protein [Lactobacillus kefiranofaciens subsp. kefiranofaciens]WGO85845.1 replication/maintenance protein RepL [Lactobacillus kefiranofaciens]WQH36835.1 replicat